MWKFRAALQGQLGKPDHKPQHKRDADILRSAFFPFVAPLPQERRRSDCSVQVSGAEYKSESLPDAMAEFLKTKHPLHMSLLLCGIKMLDAKNQVKYIPTSRYIFYWKEGP